MTTPRANLRFTYCTRSTRYLRRSAEQRRSLVAADRTHLSTTTWVPSVNQILTHLRLIVPARLRDGRCPRQRGATPRPTHARRFRRLLVSRPDCVPVRPDRVPGRPPRVPLPPARALPPTTHSATRPKSTLPGSECAHSVGARQRGPLSWPCHREPLLGPAHDQPVTARWVAEWAVGLELPRDVVQHKERLAAAKDSV
jgi:hypothetical protein